MKCQLCDGQGSIDHFIDNGVCESSSECSNCGGLGEIDCTVLTDEQLHELCGNDVEMWVKAFLEAGDMTANSIQHWFELVREAQRREDCEHELNFLKDVIFIPKKFKIFRDSPPSVFNPIIK